MIFSVMPGNPSGIEFLHKKRCLWQGACLEMSSSAATAEKREVNASGLLLHMLCCAGVQPRLLSPICNHLALAHKPWHRNLVSVPDSVPGALQKRCARF